MSKLDLLNKYDMTLLFAALDNLIIDGSLTSSAASSLAVKQRVEQIKEKLGK